MIRKTAGDRMDRLEKTRVAADIFDDRIVANPLPPAVHKHADVYVWYVIGLLTVVNIVNYMDRVALAVLLPSIKADLQLSDGQLGLLVGLAFSIFYAICAIPIAHWADQGIRRSIVAMALGTWSLMTALCGVAQNFWQLFAARVGVGAGEAGCLPPSQSILCDYVPYERRSGVFAIHSVAAGIGLMFGMAVAGRLGEVIGWRWTFVALGLPGVALAILVRLTLREPVRGSFDAATAIRARISFGGTLGVLWRCKTFRLLLMVFTFSGFITSGLVQWWPTFYTRLFGLNLSSGGVSLGLTVGTGQIAGILIGGVLANKLAKRNAGQPLQIGAVGAILAIPAALGALFISTTFGSMLLASLTIFFGAVSSGPILAAAYSVVAPDMRARAGAAVMFCTSVLGLGLGPFCVGLISDLLAPSLRTEALRYALLAPVCLLPVKAYLFHAAAKQLPTDLKLMPPPSQL